MWLVLFVPSLSLQFSYTLSLPLVLLNECQPSSAVPKVGVLPLNRAPFLYLLHISVDDLTKAGSQYCALMERNN